MGDSNSGNETGIVIRVDDSPEALPENHWDALLSVQARPTPFMRLAYLRALHASGSAVAKTGWQPQYVSLWRGEELLAACPAYLKGHSYGEYGGLCRIGSVVQLIPAAPHDQQRSATNRRRGGGTHR